MCQEKIFGMPTHEGANFDGSKIPISLHLLLVGELRKS